MKWPLHREERFCLRFQQVAREITQERLLAEASFIAIEHDAGGSRRCGKLLGQGRVIFTGIRRARGHIDDAETFGCTPASVTIIPENECPARTVAPCCRLSTRSAASTASVSVVSGFCTEVTLSPTASNRGITSDQLEPSAKRPWTSTTLFAGGAVCAKAARDSSGITAAADVKPTKVRLSMSPSSWSLIASPRPRIASHEVSPPSPQYLPAIALRTARSDASRMRRRPGTLRTRECSYRRP